MQRGKSPVVASNSMRLMTSGRGSGADGVGRGSRRGNRGGVQKSIFLVRAYTVSHV
jgi:hypothetical protein